MELSNWGIVSLNGDHTAYPNSDTDPGVEGDVIARFEDAVLTGGIAQMDDGRILAVTQNIKPSAGGYQYSWKDTGDVVYATARFVTGPTSVGPYAVIWDGDDIFPYSYTGPLNGSQTYYQTGMQTGYQQIVPLGDYAVVAFWVSSRTIASASVQLDRFDIVLLDVSGTTPVVVDTDVYYGERNTGIEQNEGINEPDIGKAADDIFVMFDNPTVSGVRKYHVTAYRVGAGGLTKGTTYVDTVGHSYSMGMAGHDGEFMVVLDSVAFGGTAGNAWLGTVNTSTLAITKDATATWDNVISDAPYSAERYANNVDINIAMTHRLPAPRIGIVGGNFWSDLFEIERIGNTVQISNAFAGVAKRESYHFPYFYFNVGHSWPTAHDETGKVHTIAMVYDQNENAWHLWFWYDIFGAKIPIEITDESWGPVADHLWVINDDNFYASMDMVIIGRKCYLKLNSNVWWSEVDPGSYEWGHYGMQKNPPWGQYYLITFDLPTVGQLYVNLSEERTNPNWVSVCPVENEHSDELMTGHWFYDPNNLQDYWQIHQSKAYVNVEEDDEDVWWTCCSHGL